jgi:DNA topoisomerase-3
MRLFIAEKPSVAKAIAGELGVTSKGDGFIQCGDDTITWCFGHMLEQADPDAYTPDDVPTSPTTGKKLWRVEELPIIPATWIMKPRADAKQQLAVIGKLLKQASEVVNAGDPDREGQLLVDEVLEHFGSNNPVKRFWVSAQDSVSVQRGLAALKDNSQYHGWGAAAQARGRADWLIGMNLSRAYTLRAGRGGSRALLTVGRVQTPTPAQSWSPVTAKSKPSSRSRTTPSPRRFSTRTATSSPAGKPRKTRPA